MGMFIFWLTVVVGIWLLWNICRNTGESLDKQTAIQYEIVSLEKRIDELSEQLKGIQGTPEPVSNSKSVVPTPAEALTDASVRPVDINTADIGELVLLPRIGNALAKRIVAGRPYNSLDDLLQVQGISKEVLEDIRPRIFIS